MRSYGANDAWLGLNLDPVPTPSVMLSRVDADAIRDDSLKVQG
jgi:hypothetical protein